MAYTVEDITQIDRLIAGGATRVTFSDGRTMESRPLRELLAIKDMIKAELAGAADVPRVSYAKFTRV